MSEQFGHYVLETMIGRGGMGEVYRAYDTKRDRTVALKRLLKELANDEIFQARFRRECRLVARLNEPHVIPIHDFGEIDGHLYLDMRLVEGVDLSTIISGEGPMEPRLAVDIIGQVGAALQSAHDSGLVHRDIKPSNVLVTGMSADRQGVFAYLVDFGIARSEGAGGGTALTATTGTVGTLGYMAPERISGADGDHRSDLYSLACVLFECLTGHSPFKGETFQVMYAHVNSPPPMPSAEVSTLPRALDDVIRKGLAKDPGDRYQTAGEFAVAARAALAQAGVTPPAPPRPAPASPQNQPPGSGPVGRHSAPPQGPPIAAPPPVGPPIQRGPSGPPPMRPPGPSGPAAAAQSGPPSGPGMTRPPSGPGQARPPSGPGPARPLSGPAPGRPPSGPSFGPPPGPPSGPSVPYGPPSGPQPRGPISGPHNTGAGSGAGGFFSNRKNLIPLAIAAVVVIVAVIVIVVVSSGGNNSQAGRSTSPSPSGSVSGTATDAAGWSKYADFTKLIGDKPDDTTDAYKGGTCTLEPPDATVTGMLDQITCKNLSVSKLEIGIARFSSASDVTNYGNNLVDSKMYSKEYWTIDTMRRGLLYKAPAAAGDADVTSTICAMPTYLVQFYAPAGSGLTTDTVYTQYWKSAPFPNNTPPVCSS